MGWERALLAFLGWASRRTRAWLPVAVVGLAVPAYVSGAHAAGWTAGRDTGRSFANGEQVVPNLAFVASASRGLEPKPDPTRIEVALSAPSAGTVSVSYAMSGGDATAGEDFLLADGQLTFEPDSVKAFVPLKVLPDYLVELDETVVIAVSDPVNANMPDVFDHVYTIENDDFGVCRGKASTFAG